MATRSSLRGEAERTERARDPSGALGEAEWEGGRSGGDGENEWGDEASPEDPGWDRDEEGEMRSLDAQRALGECAQLITADELCAWS